MYEYTVLVCAQTGELDHALLDPRIDDELLEGAGQILFTLIVGRNGGPAEGIESYAEGALAAGCYLKHLTNRDNNLKTLVNVDKIEQFLNDKKYGIDS